MSLGKIRSALYRAGRLLGDANAVQKGKVGERVERRLVGRLFSRILAALFRGRRRS